MGKVLIHYADGCPRLKSDICHLFKYFSDNKWQITTQIPEAELIVVGICGFNQLHEEISFGLLSHIFKKKKSGTNVITVGCLTGINEERLVKNYDVINIKPTNLDYFDEVINASQKLRDTDPQSITDEYMKMATDAIGFGNYPAKVKALFKTHNFPLTRLLSGKRAEALSKRYNDVFTIRVARGCSGKCSYCAIKNVSGPTKSISLEKIIGQFERGLADGNKVFRLIAEDVGAYGSDNGSNIAELLDALFNYPDDFKLAWDDFSPKWLIRYRDDLKGIFSRNKERIGYIGLPMQTGSEKVIQLMKREHTIKDAVESITAIREAIPELDISSHIIVGFPGETEKDFQDTLNMLHQVNFKMIYAYRYDDRPNIESVRLPNKVPHKVAAERLKRLHKEFPNARI